MKQAKMFNEICKKLPKIRVVKCFGTVMEIQI